MTPPAAATRTLPRTRVGQFPRAPRRVSGPAARNRRDDAARKAARRTATTDPFVLRALRRTRQLADSRFLDRLIRGRLWIPLVAAGLMGIVFMQVSMLKLNAGIGRAVTSASTLERQNSALRADVSHLESGSRIDSEAHALGMVVPADGTTTYVRATGARQATDAASKMTPVDPNAIARAQAGTALAAGQAAGTTTTGSATAAPTPAQAQAEAQAPATQQQPTATTSTTTGAGTGAGAATATGTTAAAAPPAPVAQTPAATGTTGATGAASAPTQQQQAQAQTASATSGGAVAPSPQG